jgi:hypothetical protein
LFYFAVLRIEPSTKGSIMLGKHCHWVIFPASSHILEAPYLLPCFCLILFHYYTIFKTISIPQKWPKKLGFLKYHFKFLNFSLEDSFQCTVVIIPSWSSNCPIFGQQELPKSFWSDRRSLWKFSCHHVWHHAQAPALCFWPGTSHFSQTPIWMSLL